MNIRRSRGALTRALMQRARNNRSAKALANRYSRANTTTKNSKSGTSANKTTDTTKVTLYEKVEKAADNLQDYAALLIKLGKTEITSEGEKKTDTTASSTTNQNTATTENTTGQTTTTDYATGQTTTDDKGVNQSATTGSETVNETNKSETEANTAQSATTSTKDAATLKKEQELQEDIVEAVEKLVSNFNAVYENLNELGGTVNTMYATRIKNLAYSNKTKLAEVGITQNKNGTLAIDEKKLKVVDLEKLKAVFCKESGLIGDLQEHAKSMKESAAATASVLNKMYGSSTYNQYGASSSYFNHAGNLYNYWG